MIVWSCLTEKAIGTPDPDAEMQHISRDWDTASLWHFNVVPLADMLLSGQAVAYVFQQLNKDIEKGP